MEKVKYISQSKKLDDGIIDLKYQYYSVEDRFIRLYYGTIYMLAGATPCERDLMDFLVEDMNDDNKIVHSASTRYSFRARMKQIFEKRKDDPPYKEYSDASIKKAFRMLKEKGLLISIDKGTYIVNPEYFFKATERKRLEKIKLVLEFQKGMRDSSFKLITESK